MICNNRWNNIRTVSRFENAYNDSTSIQHDPGVLVMISQSIIMCWLYVPFFDHILLN